MTRWKREPIASLRFMHAHHRYSRWHHCVIQAAESLGLVVAVRVFPNWNDGSTDREWYTLAAALERVGGMKAVNDRASELHDTDSLTA